MASPNSNGFAPAVTTPVSCERVRLHSTSETSTPPAAIKPSGRPRTAAREAFTSLTITTTRRNMIVQAATIASTHADAMAGSYRLRWEKLKVTAVLDTRPPRIPVARSPCSFPSTLTSTYPRKFNPAISTTISQILYGLMTLTGAGPNASLGKSGRMMTLITANLRVASTSSSSTRRASRCKYSFRVSSKRQTTVATLATPTLSQPHKAPTMKASSAEISVVIPNSPRAAVIAYDTTNRALMAMKAASTTHP